MNYDVDYFINKFEAIPEDLWCIDVLFDGYGRACAYGHCDDAESEVFEQLDYEFGYLINKGTFLLNRRRQDTIFADINNGCYSNYQQPTPKQRILAALYDIKKMQQPEYKDLTKSLAILPIEETPDKVIVEEKVNQI